MKRVVTTVVFCFLLLQIHAQDKENLQHTGSWEAALHKAQTENKLIFVDCYFTGCMPCARMDKEVFPNAVINRELEKNFVGIKVDVFKEKLGDTINMKYGVSGFPTFLILDKSGKLLSMFSGYQDPSMLMKYLDDAKRKASQGQFLSGFSISNVIAWPGFYKKYYDRESRASDAAAANAWIKGQKDWTAEMVALPIFRTGKLDEEIEEYLIGNYSQYRSMYGASLVQAKLASVLSTRLGKAVKTKGGEKAFRQFLQDHSRYFPADDWRIFRFLLGYTYYGSMAKDTLGLLHFINEEPVVYMNYFGSLYSTMVVKKQLNETTLPLMASWIDKVADTGVSFELLSIGASILKQNNNTEGNRRLIIMAIERAKKFEMPTASYEKMLASQSE